MKGIEYHIRIKRDYAKDEMLRLQEEDAIEIITNIPEWQKERLGQRVDERCFSSSF